MLNLVDLLEEELFAAEARRYETEAGPSSACYLLVERHSATHSPLLGEGLAV